MQTPPRAIQLRTRIRISFISGLAPLLLAGAAWADRRDFVRAYQYATQPEGNLEVEVWNDVDAPPAGGFDQAVQTTRFELEYGLTDHWDVALYHVLEQDPAAPLHFDSWRLETRYRLAEKGLWPVDVMLYLEGERPAAFGDPWEIEEKIILGRDFGPLQLVTNLVAEQKVLDAAEGHLWEIDAGARWELAPAWHVAGEFWTTHETVNGVTNAAWYAGPSISWASSRVWVQLGAGFGLGDATTGATFVRSVLGFNL